MRYAFLLCAALAAFLPAAVSARPVDFSDLRRLTGFSDPQLSPDGREVVFVRTHANFAKDRTDGALMLLNVATHGMRHLTWGRRGVSNPQWSPDGGRLAFAASAQTGKEKQQQIFVLRDDGGDAQQVTTLDKGVDAFAWSPDGRSFAVVTSDKDPAEKAIAAHHDAFQVGDNDYLHTSKSVSSHLWLVKSDGSGKPRRLTHGSWSLGTVDPSFVTSPTFSPDGRLVAVVRYPTPDYGDALRSVVELVDTQTGRLRALTGNSGLENRPSFAPATGYVAYVRNSKGDPTNGNAIYVTRPGAGPGRDVRGCIDRNAGSATWTSDGTALWMIAENGPDSALYFSPANGCAQRVPLGNVEVAALGNTARNGALVFTGNTNTHPSELYLLRKRGDAPVELTNENGFVAHRTLGRTQHVTWRNGGFNEDGILVYPPGYAAGKKYPLVLVIHGGPQSASQFGWNSRAQLFASHGYLVFSPNYRGSTNLGDRYEHAISRDAGVGPGSDAMAGLAKVLSLSIVDKSRIGVTGWSYGGYMTSWLIGHYHPWKVAVSGAALNDWIYDYNIAFYVHTDEPFFGGSPWDPRYSAMWRAQSPITYAQNIRTPTLIMGDIGDNNVVIPNSFEMYHALKDNGVPVKFIAYPVHGHYPSDPVRSENVSQNWLAWLDLYLK